MEADRIADLLGPFFDDSTSDDASSQHQSVTPQPSAKFAFVSPSQVSSISMYVDLLTRWNARLNLTAIGQPEEIVTRHFGESLFAARILFPSPGSEASPPVHLADVGSGAGFPGLPIKIWAPQIHLTLIESKQKKATFLRETIRALALPDAEVFAGRAEEFPAASSDVVTLRAVERFEDALPLAAALLRPGRPPRPPNRSRPICERTPSASCSPLEGTRPHSADRQSDTNDRHGVLAEPPLSLLLALRRGTKMVKCLLAEHVE